MKKTLTLSLLLLLGQLTFGQTADFTYYKFESIKYAERMADGKYKADKTEAVNVVLKKDNTFNTYTFFYVDPKRNKTGIHFQTSKKTKFVFIENSDNETTNEDVPYLNSFNLFMVGTYIIDDKLSQNKLVVLSMMCKDYQVVCDYEKEGIVTGRYSFSNPQKITKTEFDKLKK
jgi:hypothetical protein